MKKVLIACLQIGPGICGCLARGLELAFPILDYNRYASIGKLYPISPGKGCIFPLRLGCNELIKL